MEGGSEEEQKLNVEKKKEEKKEEKKVEQKPGKEAEKSEEEDKEKKKAEEEAEKLNTEIEALRRQIGESLVIEKQFLNKESFKEYLLKLNELEGLSYKNKLDKFNEIQKKSKEKRQKMLTSIKEEFASKSEEEQKRQLAETFSLLMKEAQIESMNISDKTFFVDKNGQLHTKRQAEIRDLKGALKEETEVIDQETDVYKQLISALEKQYEHVDKEQKDRSPIVDIITLGLLALKDEFEKARLKDQIEKALEDNIENRYAQLKTLKNLKWYQHANTTNESKLVFSEAFKKNKENIELEQSALEKKRSRPSSPRQLVSEIGG